MDKRNRIGLTATGIGDHDNCVIDLTSELLNSGYSVYLEYPFYLVDRENQNAERLVVDIYALKGNKEIIIEVGSLSPTHTSVPSPIFVREERFKLLKNLCPRARIIHVTQWKNWISNSEVEQEWDHQYWKQHANIREINEDMDARLKAYLAKGPQLVSSEEIDKMGRSLIKNQ